MTIPVLRYGAHPYSFGPIIFLAGAVDALRASDGPITFPIAAAD